MKKHRLALNIPLPLHLLLREWHPPQGERVHRCPHTGGRASHLSFMHNGRQCGARFSLCPYAVAHAVSSAGIFSPSAPSAPYMSAGAPSAWRLPRGKRASGTWWTDGRHVVDERTPHGIRMPGDVFCTAHTKSAGSTKGLSRTVNPSNVSSL